MGYVRAVNESGPRCRWAARLCAFTISIYTEDGEFVCEHERSYGDVPTDTCDPASQLPLLCIKSDAWRNSKVRTALSDELREYFDSVRDERKIARLMRKAKFPQIKSFEGYDYSQVSFPEGYTSNDLECASFLDAAQDFVFYGQTGRGKTHLAIAIGIKCVQLGKEARFGKIEVVISLPRGVLS